MAIPILNAKSYYTLEYSLISDNKILQVNGSVKNNELNGTMSLVNEYVQELYSDINNETLSLPLGFENNENLKISHWYDVHGSYHNPDTQTTYDVGYGRTEYLKITKVFDVVADKPIKLSKINISATGKGYKNSVSSGHTVTDMKYDNMIAQFPLTSKDDKFVLFNDSKNAYFDKNKVGSLNTETKFIYEYDLVTPEIISDDHYRYVNKIMVSPDAFGPVGSIQDKTSNQEDLSYDNIIVDVLQLNDYSYRISIDFIPKLNVVITSREPREFPGEFTDSFAIIMYNVVDKFNVSIDAYTISGESIIYEYHTNVANYKKYKIMISSNELITNMLTKSGIIWQKYISDVLLTKFNKGKFWIKAKIKNNFINNNNIHINSKIRIKDVDGDYISRNYNPCTFEVKNIETVYEESQYYYNVVLMEV